MDIKKINKRHETNKKKCWNVKEAKRLNILKLIRIIEIQYCRHETNKKNCWSVKKAKRLNILKMIKIIEIQYYRKLTKQAKSEK